MFIEYCRSKYDVKLYAFVIMEDHFHLIAGARDLSTRMQVLKEFYVKKAAGEYAGKKLEWLLNQLSFFKNNGKQSFENRSVSKLELGNEQENIPVRNNRLSTRAPYRVIRERNILHKQKRRNFYRKAEYGFKGFLLGLSVLYGNTHCIEGLIDFLNTWAFHVGLFQYFSKLG